MAYVNVEVVVLVVLLLLWMELKMMVSFGSVLRWVLWVFLTAMASSIVLSSVSFASTVRVCKNLKQSRYVEENQAENQAKRRVYCSLSSRVGRVGESVEIKNEYNYIVAIGRIVRHSRSSTVIMLTQYNSRVGTMAGFPVMVRSQENQDYWTVTTAPF